MASTWTTPSSSVLPRAPTDARAETQRTRAGRIGRAVLLAIGATLAVGASMREPRVKATDRNQAVVEILKTRGFTVDEPGDVVFVDPPKGLLGAAFGRSRVLVRARAVPKDPLLGEQLTDIYLFEAKLTPSGALVDLEGGYNLSDTTGAEETRPLVHGEQIAFASLSGIQGAPSIVTILDFNGQTVPSTFSASDRIKNGVTNLQATGRYRGLSRRTFVVGFDTTRIDPKTGLPIPGSEDAAAEDAAAGPTPDPADMELSLDGDHVVVAFANEHARLPFTGALPKEDALPKWLHYDPFELAPPGNLVTWSVDRVRLEIGDENMQAIKEKFFDMKDFVDRNREEMTGATGEDEIAEDLGEALGTPKREIPVDPDMGWPPPPLEPWVTPALPGEGKWNAKDDAAFYNNQPNLPPTFLTTFIRSDRTRKVTRAYIVLWDPRQVELHMMAGTVEPKGATGKAGPGLIPRTPDIMKRLVAATNAGFQALHGEFGMMADGVVYLPPKPYAATVMKLRDGSTAFGTWPDDPNIPDQVVSYRQNMTVMVQDEQFNPYNRTWWGGTVPGAEDKTHTTRTGICLTREDFVAYFYGDDLSPEALAQAMIQTRCKYGLALDMNPGHSGLEFYKVTPDAQTPSLGRPFETSWEAEGSVPDLDGWTFRAKRLVKGMGLMNFPRYIKREARDFFYLTLRHILPGENFPTAFSPAAEGEGSWVLKGLPQHGFPYAMAMTETRPEKADANLKFRVLELDPRALDAQLGPAPATGEPADAAPVVLTVDGGAGPDGADTTLWLHAHAFSVGNDPPGKSAARLARGSSKPIQGAAVACVHDESNVLFYAELENAAGRKVDLTKMGELLTQVGCSELVYLAEPLAIVLGDNTDLSRNAQFPPRAPTTVRLRRAKAPAGMRFFEDTPVVSRDVWYPLQQQRIRYFKKHD